VVGRAHIGIETHKRQQQQQQQQQEAFLCEGETGHTVMEYFTDSRMSWSIDGFRTAAALQDSLLLTNLQRKLQNNYERLLRHNFSIIPETKP
jgi:hypothetical protein